MINKYIAQKKYMKDNPESVNKEKLEIHGILRDEILMRIVKGNDKTDNVKPFYDNIKKEVIK
jgi:hypothetical protein